MIKLTKEEAVNILRSISRIEGYLYSVRGGDRIREDVIVVSDLMRDKLKEEGTEND